MFNLHFSFAKPNNTDAAYIFLSVLIKNANNEFYTLSKTLISNDVWKESSLAYVAVVIAWSSGCGNGNWQMYSISCRNENKSELHLYSTDLTNWI